MWKLMCDLVGYAEGLNNNTRRKARSSWEGIRRADLGLLGLVCARIVYGPAETMIKLSNRLIRLIYSSFCLLS
jgi:hypothetical protein